MIKLQPITTIDHLIETQGAPTGNAIIDALVEWVNTNQSNVVTDAAHAIGIPQRLLCDTVKFFVGTTAQELIQRLRMEQALTMLSNPDITNDEVVTACHFNSQHYLEQLIKKYYQTTLRAYRTGAARRDFNLTEKQRNEVNKNAQKLRNRSVTE